MSLFNIKSEEIDDKDINDIEIPMGIHSIVSIIDAQGGFSLLFATTFKWLFLWNIKT